MSGPPTDLSYPWISEFDPNYQAYYYVNTQTGERTWTHPVSGHNYGPPAGPPPPQQSGYGSEDRSLFGGSSNNNSYQGGSNGSRPGFGGMIGNMGGMGKFAAEGGAALATYEFMEHEQREDGGRVHHVEDALFAGGAAFGVNEFIKYEERKNHQYSQNQPQQQQQYYNQGPPQGQYQQQYQQQFQQQYYPQQQQQQGGGFLSSGLGKTVLGGGAALGAFELYEHEKHKHEREEEVSANYVRDGARRAKLGVNSVIIIIVEKSIEFLQSCLYVLEMSA